MSTVTDRIAGSSLGSLFGARRNEQGFSRASARPGSGSVIRIHGVEGWRALACVLVVTYHVWQNMDPLHNGVGPWSDHAGVLGFFLNIDLVVDLFFVLSGLLLFLPFANAALDDSVRIPDRRNFMFRRILRLYPLYFILVCACWFPRNFGAATAQWRDLVEHLLLVQSFDSTRIFYTIGPAWTLSVEWIFYVSLALLGPIAVRWVRRLPTTQLRVRRLLFGLGGVALASILYKANVELVWRPPVTHWAWRFGPPAKADDFAIGMAVAVLVAALRGRTLPTWLLPVQLTATIGLLWAVHLPSDKIPDPGLLVVRHTGASVAWAIMLFAFITCRNTRPARIVDNPVLVRVGLLTFAIYLVHEPVLLALTSAGWFSQAPSHFVLNLALVFAGTAILATIAHRMVEEPWTDAAALQRRGGGRAELYPAHAAATPERTPDTGRLREGLLASIEASRDQDVTTTGAHR